MIKIKKATNRQFYFVITAKNNKVLVTSETYKRRESVIKGIRAVLSVLGIKTAVIVNENGVGERV